MTLGMTLEASWLGLALLALEGGEANTARPKHPLSDGTVSLGFPGAARPLTPPPGAQPEGRHILSQSTPIREGNPLATAHVDTQCPPKVIVASLQGASWLGSHSRLWSLLRGQHPHTILSPPGCGSPLRVPWMPGLGHPGDSEDLLPHPERLTCGSRNQTVAGIRDGGGWGPDCHQVKYQPLVPVAREAGLDGVAPSSGAWRLCGEAPSSQGPSSSLWSTHRPGPLPQPGRQAPHLSPGWLLLLDLLINNATGRGRGGAPPAIPVTHLPTCRPGLLSSQGQTWWLAQGHPCIGGAIVREALV